MSDATRQAMQDAIVAHLADEHNSGSAMVTGYCLIAAATSIEDMENGRVTYMTNYLNGQPYHVGLGLAHHLLDVIADDF